MNIRRNKKGFTLAELLAYLGVTSVLFITLTTFVANLGGNLRRAQTNRQLADAEQLILTTVNNEVRRAQGVKSSSDTSVTLCNPCGAGELTVAFQFVNGKLIKDGVPLHSNRVAVSAPSNGKVFTSSGNSITIRLNVVPAEPGTGVSQVALESISTIRSQLYQ